MNQLMLKTKTMSSLEIAELTGKRHDTVKLSIERLFEKGVIACPPITVVQKEVNNRNYNTEAFVFKGEQGKLDSITVVAQLCPEFTAALVKRWYELESQMPQLPNFNNPAEAARAWADEVEAKQLAQEQLQIAAPKVQYFDMVADVNNYMNATTVGQKFGMSANVLNKHLEALGVYNRAIKRGRVFQQWFVDKGLGVMKKTENGYNQSRFTNKGEQWVIEKLTGEGVI